MKLNSILVVDDDGLERLLMNNTLMRAFHTENILMAAQPEEALDLCRFDAPSCVFIDYNMLRMDGLELGALIRKEMPYIPLVLMTAVGDETLAATAIRNGFSDYVPKSRIDPESIVGIVERAVRNMEQARKIDQQREELEHFAYALSHDFRKPIRQLCSLSEILQQQIGATGDADALQNLNSMCEAATRLSALAEGMSQYMQLNKPAELGLVEIDDVVTVVRSHLEDNVAEHNGVIVSSPMQRTVYGNTTLLALVLQNLIINGLRYNKSPAPQVTLTFQDTPFGRLRLYVRDNGIGVEERFRNEIFRPLVRLHSASEFPGTGLGLTIARKAVYAMGGTIGCSSEPGTGSEFFIELLKSAPAARAETTRVPTAA